MYRSLNVGLGSLTVSATGNLDVKQRLKAKPGGSITLTSGGALETKVAAVIEVDDGGSVVISGDTGVTIGGRIFAGGAQSGSVQITSSAGLVTLNQEVRASGDPPSTITLTGAAGVVMNHNVNAVGRLGPGGALAIFSSSGDVVMKKVRIKGMDGGAVVIAAPLGAVDPGGIDAKGKLDGGSVSIAADSITVRKGIDTEGGFGNGGTIALTATTLVTVDATLDIGAADPDVPITPSCP